MEQQNMKTTPIATLPPRDRAYLALSEAHNEQALLELSRKYIDVTEIKDVTDYQLVMRGGIELMKARTAIEATGKAARKDANDYRTAVLNEERRLVAITSPEEIRLRGMRSDYDDEQERIAEETRHIEQRRVADITERIQAIRAQTDGLLGADADAIQMRLDAVSTIVCNETLFAEFVDTASDVKAAAVTSLETALAGRVALEEQQAEQQRIAEEQSARQAELDRQAAEQRGREAKAQEKIDADQAEIRRQQKEMDDKKQAEENERLAEERAAQERQAEVERLSSYLARKAEQERLDQEDASRVKAEDEAEAKRQESLRPEKDRLIDWLNKLYFMDGIELHERELNQIQMDILGILAKLAADAIRAVERT